MRFSDLKQVEVKVLAESKGVFGRNAGDKFTHHDGREYSIVQVIAFPDAQQGKFETPEDRDATIQQFEEEHSTKVEWVNNPARNMLAFGIAQLDDQDGGHVFWGKYLQQVGTDLMGSWANKQVPPGWSLATKGAQKMLAGYDPQNLIKTEQVFQGADSIINTVYNNAPDQVKEVFKEALQNLAQGKSQVVFPEMYEQQAAVRDYFGEIMQPIALMGGVIGGQADDARQALADGAEWRDCKVMWPMSMNAALCDSFMIAPNGSEIGISSKGGAGAAASAKNLHDAVVKLEKEGNTELLETVKYTADIVRTIATNDQRNGPIAVGKLLKVPNIDDTLNAEISKYIAAGKTDLEGMSQQATDLISDFAVKLETKGFNAGYALLSAASKTVAKVVNANPLFSKGAIGLLNQSSIIQVYTNIGKSGNDVVLKEFRAVYPPNFQGTVKLEGGKNYYSSRIGGKMAFNIK
mgnify:CR=1 FL=1|jgi:hypothetical protein|tara:strand:- start:487 stop:1875 length:1389 start_codon:yes stop_codon:yes gene_type:complete